MKKENSTSLKRQKNNSILSALNIKEGIPIGMPFKAIYIKSGEG